MCMSTEFYLSVHKKLRILCLTCVVIMPVVHGAFSLSINAHAQTMELKTSAKKVLRMF